MCENKDRNKAHRPDLELERLVMGEEADGVRPSEGWLVREDVARGAVEQIKSARDRAKRHAEDMQLAIARQNAALAERNQARVQKLDADKVAEELRDQVEALTAQLEEEEAQVKRLREVVLGAPKWWVDTVPVGDRERPRLMTYRPTGSSGYYAVLVRLSADGTELAGDVDGNGRARTGTDTDGGSPPDMKAMAEGWVRSVRGDGLVNPEAGCGCALGDLMPCDHNTCDCMPARRFFCLECEEATFQGCLGTPALPPVCFECGGPTMPWPAGAPVPEKLTTENTNRGCMSGFAETWLVVRFCRREVRGLIKEVARRQRFRAWCRARGIDYLPEVGGKAER